MISSVFILLALGGGLAGAQTSGSFNVLTYNVAGLPDILSSGNPEVNTPLISTRLGPYSVVNVQEDFNYHAALYRDDRHPHRSATSGGVPFGDGLNTLSNYPFMEEQRVKWERCNLNSGDCLTPKGFHFLRVRVAEGVWFDLYNLHTDAGSDSADQTARASNIQQVLTFARTWSAGMPIVVMGDTNSRYTTASDGQALRNFVSSLGLVDPWVKIIRGGNPPPLGSGALSCPKPFPSGTSQATIDACEVVDKIFVRGSPAVTFTATAYANDNNKFVDSANLPLSDHYPHSSVIAWSLSSSTRLGDPVGGPHGNPFNGIATLIEGKSVPKLTTITLRGGSRMDGVSYAVSYAGGGSTTTTHGGSGGTASTLTLNPGERVTQVTMCEGQKDSRTRVFSVSLLTSTGRTLAAGTTTGSCTTSRAPTTAGSGGAWGLVSFWGRSGEELDRLGAVWGAVY